MLEWFFISFDFVFVVTFNLFPEKKIPIIWSKRKRRTDDGIESITNCLYVKCNAKNTTTSKKIMNYKKWLFIAGFSLFSFQIWFGYFLGRWKDAENCIFFEKCTLEDFWAAAKLFSWNSIKYSFFIFQSGTKNC